MKSSSVFQCACVCVWFFFFALSCAGALLHACLGGFPSQIWDDIKWKKMGLAQRDGKKIDGSNSH